MELAYEEAHMQNESKTNSGYDTMQNILFNNLDYLV